MALTVSAWKGRVPLLAIFLVGATLFFYTYAPRGIGGGLLPVVLFDDIGKLKLADKDTNTSCVLYDSSHRCLCLSSDHSASALNGTSIFSAASLANIKNIKCAMTINAIGRLGNLMGEYATLYALSRLNGRPAFLLPEMKTLLNDYFSLSIPAMDYHVATTYSWTDHHLHDWMSPEYNSFTGYFVKLHGYTCSWTFYHHLRDEIRREFQFHDYIIREANKYLTYLRGNRTSVTFIGVHIRRGDYVELMKSSYDGVLADSQYFLEAMEYFRSRYPDCLFVVCSDDLNWARANVNASKNDVVFGWFGLAYSSGHDMALLSRCNHTIMSMGTYGFWSAYLAGGEVVYLLNFTRPESKFLKVFSYEKNLLPEWHGIPARNLYLPSDHYNTFDYYCNNCFYS